MKRNVFQKITCLVLSVTILMGILVVPSFAREKTKKPNGTASSLEEMQALVGISSYEKYLSEYGAAKPGPSEIVIDVTKFQEGSDAEIVADSKYCDLGDEKYWTNFGDNAENSVYLPPNNKETGKAGVVTWNFEVADGWEGLYNIYIEYYNCNTSQSSVSAIQRKLKIDGKVPFSEVGSISLDKHWKYTYGEEGEDCIVIPETDADSKYGAPGTYVEYVTEKDGYFKVETRVYKKDNKLKQEVIKYKMAQDINGNSMTPGLVESCEWSTYICRDTSGYYDGYFKFYMSNGTHQITLEAEREPVVIKSIKLVPAAAGDTNSIDSYEDYLKDIYEHKENVTLGDANTGSVRIEAEFPDLVSDASVVASNSNDSAANYPISSGAQLFNIIGETSYSAVGQWAAYKFTVNSDGLYKLGMRYKQNGLQGMFVCRSIKLSGGDYGLSDGSPTAPFAEAQNIRFDYSDAWQSSFLSGYVTKGEGDEATSEKTDFMFYFEEGVEYTIYIECSLGDLRSYVQTIENSLTKLNEYYLRIIQRTGSTPDVNQTYDFYKEMPDVVVGLLEQAITLDTVSKDLEALCGTTGSHLATLDTIARILDTMGSDNGEQIAANVSTLKSYLGTLGTWITDSKTGLLMMDSIYVIPAANDGSALPKAQPNFFESIWLEITSFIYSFFTDYDQMGLTVVPDENTAYLDVWLAMGRDQSQIWRTMIDAKDVGFTDTTNNAVALKLVTAGTLLPSILAGKGPDVYMGLGSADVINYAIRDAVLAVNGTATELTDEENTVFTTFLYRNKTTGEDVRLTVEQVLELQEKGGLDDLTLISEDFTGFTVGYKYDKDGKLVARTDDDDESVAIKQSAGGNFALAAMNTLTLNNQCFGIPMTMSFAMMFYRMDVLAELGEEVPETWEELLALLPVLQVNNMSLGVTYVSALDFMMYQRGGNMWKFPDDPTYAGAAIDLDSDVALEAFDFVCRLYTDYSLPVTFDAANRFRTGEMPLVIGDYASIYNTLTVYATEIEGLWEFSSLPGSEDPTDKVDGFNYDSLAGISATVIPNGCDDFKAAWEFVQWQTSAKVQADYGNKIVALIGPAAKYETANINAIEDLSWTASEKAAIKDQMANLNAIVNYPGSYIISRYMKFAFLDAYNDGANPVEAMLSYINSINGEITRKRQEFGMKTYDDYKAAEQNADETAMIEISSLHTDL